MIVLHKFLPSRSFNFSTAILGKDIVSEEKLNKKVERELKLAHKREESKRHRLLHKEEILEREKQYREKNLLLLRERQRQHYLKKNATKPFTPRKNKSWRLDELREYLEKLKVDLHLSDVSDWYRVSRFQVIEAGGKGLLTTFGNLGEALELAYPEITWDKEKLSFRGKKSGQRWLRVMLEKILPLKLDSNGNIQNGPVEIIEDYHHPLLPWGKKRAIGEDDNRNNLKMQLDIWVPEYNLALEYQGEQHYYDIHTAFGPNFTSALYTERDSQKNKLCKQKGITLAIIPYWWDGSSESLQATLHILCPEIFPSNEADPIPMNPPVASPKVSNVLLDYLVLNFLHWLNF